MTLVERVRRLKVGKGFIVQTASEQTQVLNIAKALGRRITTRKRIKGGWDVVRLMNDL